MIQFVEENVKFPLPNKNLTKKWIKLVIEASQKKVGDICIIFCDDEYLLNINRQYLNHDYYTDIITFDYVEGNKISGDLFISLDTVKSNSVKFSESFELEAKRVIIHGILHLLGLKDKSETEALEMRSAENRALELYPSL
ncbi:MAG: rRNA maturation RNase YbeY [Chitinophagales bacterium]|nr:rRNA maturation RNase YbeY [Chitinophagales bacterium]